MEFLHPHVAARVIDDSFVSVTADGSTALLAPFFSAKGKDGSIETFTATANFINEYGEPNYAKYGQSAYNIVNWLNAGGTVYACRLVPKNATYSNTSLVVEFDAKEEAKTSLVKASVKSEGAVSKAAIEASLNTEGFSKEGDVTKVNLGYFLAKGRGEAYNGYGIKVQRATSLDNTYDFPTYNLEVLGRDELGNDITLEGPFVVSFYQGARDTARQSMYFADVLNKYSTFIEVIGNRTAFDTLAKAMVGDNDVDPRKVDILYGLHHQSIASNFTGITFKQGDDEHGENYSADALNSAKPAPLAGGTDGDDLNKVVGSDSNLTVGDQLLASFFTGLNGLEIVNDTRALYVDVILDANYSKAVKTAIYDLIKRREDCIGIFDCGFQANMKQTVDAKKETNFNNHLVSYFGQDGYIDDTYTGSTIRLTSTYPLANKIVTTDRTHGVHYPFVGPRRGVVEGFSNINFYPDPTQKETLYTNKVNYIERDPRKENFATQTTSQLKNSALSDISHVRTLLKIRRAVKEMCEDYRLEFNDAVTLDNMSFDINNYLKQWVANRACTQCTATVSATEYEKLQRIARVVINIKFTGILERIQIDLVVGK